MLCHRQQGQIPFHLGELVLLHFGHLSFGHTVLVSVLAQDLLAGKFQSHVATNDLQGGSAQLVIMSTDREGVTSPFLSIFS